MKSFFLFLSLALLSTHYIQDQEDVKLDWAKSMDGMPGLNLGQGCDLITDASGNVYMAGIFAGTVDFDPSANSYNLTSNGAYSTFIQKLDNAGNLIWAKDIENGFGKSIALDASGNIYVIGNYEGSTTDFDPGPNTFNQTPVGSQDFYILKLDNNGNFGWVKTIGSSSFDSGESISVNSNGIYITGNFEGTADFDPSTNTANQTSNGGSDIYILKLDLNGNFAWVKTIGGTANEKGNNLHLDANGNIYTTGSFEGTVDFDPSPNISNKTSNGNTDTYILKLDANGNFTWAETIGGSANDQGNAITSSSSNIYITGYFSDTTDFDPSTSTANQVSNGNADIYILKLTTSGHFAWVKTIGGSNFDKGSSIYIDNQENVYTSGTFVSLVDFDPNSGTHNLTSMHSSGEFFLSKLDLSGNLIWAHSMPGSSSGSSAPRIVVDASKNVYTTGGYSGTLDFDPRLGTHNLVGPTNLGDSYIYALKLAPCTNTTNIRTEKACDSFIDTDGQKYTQSGQFTRTLTNASGCDSTIILNLTINYTSYNTAYETACDSFIAADGQVYYNSGQYPAVIPNAKNCDSIITLNLTINHTSYNTTSKTACDNFIAANGQVLDTSGQYLITIPNSKNCDSIITLNLTIESSSALDTGIVQNNDTLTSNASGTNISYQWVDCSNNYAAISGETNQSFVATSNGTYAVILYNTNCTDTSSCYNITNASISKSYDNSDINIYPTPSRNKLSIELIGSSIQPTKIYIYNNLGQLVLQTPFKEQINVAHLPQGIYQVLLYQEHKPITQKRIIISQ
ncbi:MAG: T9SS type A sorting domain-containing protein [Aureispira sp.]|nr:T9SS type A sorting domain-containing protein [Aureispira sp.]